MTDLLWLMSFYSCVEHRSLTMTVNYIDLCLLTPGRIIGRWQWLTYIDLCLFTPGWSIGRWQWLTYAFFSWVDHRSLTMTELHWLIPVYSWADHRPLTMTELFWVMSFYPWVDHRPLTMTVTYFDWCFSTPGWGICRWQWLTYLDLCLFTSG
jgi:hypothetical protein